MTPKNEIKIDPKNTRNGMCYVILGNEDVCRIQPCDSISILDRIGGKFFSKNNLMKLLCSLLMLFIGITANSQEFNGRYTSDYTSFKDNLNPDNNFRETTRFNIAIEFENEIGIVAIQDPRIPDKILVYGMEQALDKIEIDGTIYYRYESVALHAENLIENLITLYRSNSGELNLMVLNDDYSQMFHALKKDE